MSGQLNNTSPKQSAGVGSREHGVSVSKSQLPSRSASVPGESSKAAWLSCLVADAQLGSVRYSPVWSRSSGASRWTREGKRPAALEPDRVVVRLRTLVAETR